MIKRFTIELDHELLERAKRALGETTAHGAIEHALRDAAERAESACTSHRRRYFETLSSAVELDVLASDNMWRT